MDDDRPTIAQALANRGEPDERLNLAFVLAIVAGDRSQDWQRVGPELISSLLGGPYDRVSLFRETVAHLDKVAILPNNKRAARYAIERVLDGKPPREDNETVEAVAFLVHCLVVAARRFYRVSVL